MVNTITEYVWATPVRKKERKKKSDDSIYIAYPALYFFGLVAASNNTKAVKPRINGYRQKLFLKFLLKKKQKKVWKEKLIVWY